MTIRILSFLCTTFFFYRVIFELFMYEKLKRKYLREYNIIHNNKLILSIRNFNFETYLGKFFRINVLLNSIKLSSFSISFCGKKVNETTSLFF